MFKNYEIGTPTKLIARCMFTIKFRHSKFFLRSSDAAQIRFGQSRYFQSFRGGDYINFKGKIRFKLIHDLFTLKVLN
jgi:hypothetical protein